MLEVQEEFKYKPSIPSNHSSNDSAAINIDEGNLGDNSHWCMLRFNDDFFYTLTAS